MRPTMFERCLRHLTDIFARAFLRPRPALRLAPVRVVAPMPPGAQPRRTRNDY